LHIVQEGYHEFDQAFFPLYPLLIKKTAIFFANNHLITGLFISNLSFIIGCILFYKLLKDQMNQQQAWLAIIALFLFPTSFYFQAVYTEGLFFFLVMASLYAFFRKNYFLSAIFSYFAALTRFVGVFLFVSYLFSFLAQEKKLTFSFVAVLLGPILGLGTYMIYLWKVYGDPLLFFSSQPSFGAGRSTKIILLPQVFYRYFKIFLQSETSLAYYRAILESGVFVLIFTVCTVYLYKAWKRKDEFGIVSGMFSLLNIFIPTLTGTFLSIPRFAILSLSFFISLASITNRKYLLLFFSSFAVLQLILFIYFSILPKEPQLSYRGQRRGIPIKIQITSLAQPQGGWC
jgi:hypothetical protein